MKLSKFFVTVLALFSLTVFLAQPCSAQRSLSFDLKPAPVIWTAGPEKMTLGDFAEIEIPAGYSFTDAKGARSALEKMKNPVPNNIIGLLKSNTGDQWIMFEFNDIGYVRPEDGRKIDEDALLKAIRDTTTQQNRDRANEKLPAVALVEWELKPSYDPDKHLLEWAIRAEYGSDGVINHTVRLLGRKGTLDAIAVSPRSSKPNLSALKQLLQCVSFKGGERYADFQTGDKVAASALVELANNESTPDAEQAMESPEPEVKKPHVLKSSAPWIVLCGAGFGGIVMLRRRSKRRLHSEYSSPVAPKPRPATRTSNVVDQTTSVAEAKPVVPELKKTLNGTNGSTDLPTASAATLKQAGNHHGTRRRKRMFNYQKFYTEMMMQSASLAYSPGLSLRNGHHIETNGNGATHADTNGNGNGHHNGEDFVTSEAIVLKATSELIASQKMLIQEQAKLIEDQSKLIEEKYRLLEKQSELLSAGLTEN